MKCPFCGNAISPGNGCHCKVGSEREALGPSDETACSLPVEGMKVTPYGWGDPLLSGAFMACVKRAASEKEVMSAFENETGLSLNRLVGRAPITIMVDDATGFSRDLVANWFDWVAINVWGEEENAGVLAHADEKTL